MAITKMMIDERVMILNTHILLCGIIIAAIPRDEMILRAVGWVFLLLYRKIGGEEP